MIVQIFHIVEVFSAAVVFTPVLEVFHVNPCVVIGCLISIVL